MQDTKGQEHIINKMNQQKTIAHKRLSDVTRKKAKRLQKTKLENEYNFSLA
jgi:hypothetical protein